MGTIPWPKLPGSFVSIWIVTANPVSPNGHLGKAVLSYFIWEFSSFSSQYETCGFLYKFLGSCACVCTNCDGWSCWQADRIKSYLSRTGKTTHLCFGGEGRGHFQRWLTGETVRRGLGIHPEHEWHLPAGWQADGRIWRKAASTHTYFLLEYIYGSLLP